MTFSISYYLPNLWVREKSGANRILTYPKFMAVNREIRIGILAKPL
jgi:hypothetical protein